MSPAGPGVHVAETQFIERTRWLARAPGLPAFRQMAVLAFAPAWGFLPKPPKHKHFQVSTEFPPSGDLPTFVTVLVGIKFLE